MYLQKLQVEWRSQICSITQYDIVQFPSPYSIVRPQKINNLYTVFHTLLSPIASDELIYLSWALLVMLISPYSFLSYIRLHVLPFSSLLSKDASLCLLYTHRLNRETTLIIIPWAAPNLVKLFASAVYRFCKNIKQVSRREYFIKPRLIDVVWHIYMLDSPFFIWPTKLKFQLIFMKTAIDTLQWSSDTSLS